MRVKTIRSNKGYKTMMNWVGTIDVDDDNDDVDDNGDIVDNELTRTKILLTNRSNKGYGTTMPAQKHWARLPLYIYVHR